MEDNQQPDADAPGNSELEPIPAMQRFLDNPFLLLLIGVLVPTIFYIIWGIIEITQIPMAE